MTMVLTKSALNTASNDVLFKSAPNITKKFGRVKKNDACIAKSAVFFSIKCDKKINHVASECLFIVGGGLNAESSGINTGRS